ncbi:MAG: hypothetical protein ACLFRI_07270, partial [Candidatus Izemoplasmataceae bacterium]
KSSLVFVEGITDYNYLVAFRSYLSDKHDFSHLKFLPVQGLFNSKLIKQLASIATNPIILVDSDHAGKKFTEDNSHNGAEVIKLDDKFEKVIEDLFSKDDREKYCNEKSLASSVWFKNNLINKKIKVTKNTVDNFTNLLNRLAV